MSLTLFTKFFLCFWGLLCTLASISRSGELSLVSFCKGRSCAGVLLMVALCCAHVVSQPNEERHSLPLCVPLIQTRWISPFLSVSTSS